MRTKFIVHGIHGKLCIPPRQDLASPKRRRTNVVPRPSSARQNGGREKHQEKLISKFGSYPTMRDRPMDRPLLRRTRRRQHLAAR